MDSDAHIIDSGNDLFHLVCVYHAIRQVIVDLGVGQVALFLAFNNKFANARLLILVQRDFSY